jgi:hypothetical protein
MTFGWCPAVVFRDLTCERPDQEGALVGPFSDPKISVASGREGVWARFEDFNDATSQRSRASSKLLDIVCGG